MKDQGFEAARRVLGNPVHLGFDENAHRVRRNLFLFSSITIYIVITGITVDPDTSFSGIHFKGLDDHKIFVALLILNGYHFAHFFWYSIEAFTEWRLRLTGQKIISEDPDEANNPRENPPDNRNSTLYYWWLEKAHHSKVRFEIIQKVGSMNNELLVKVRAGELKAFHHKNFIQTYYEVEQCRHQLSSYGNELRDMLNHPRIVYSLFRFDNWFKFFLKSQSIRWLLVECLLPLLLGLISIVLILNELFPSIWLDFKCWSNNSLLNFLYS